MPPAPGRMEGGKSNAAAGGGRRGTTRDGARAAASSRARASETRGGATERPRRGEAGSVRSVRAARRAPWGSNPKSSAMGIFGRPSFSTPSFVISACVGVAIARSASASATKAPPRDARIAVVLVRVRAPRARRSGAATARRVDARRSPRSTGWRVFTNEALDFRRSRQRNVSSASSARARARARRRRDVTNETRGTTDATDREASIASSGRAGSIAVRSRADALAGPRARRRVRSSRGLNEREERKRRRRDVGGGAPDDGVPPHRAAELRGDEEGVRRGRRREDVVPARHPQGPSRTARVDLRSRAIDPRVGVASSPDPSEPSLPPSPLPPS